MPPVRDEESETQRKAHAKRVRETRRSTQGVTLDEIKSAEELVKKKNSTMNNNNNNNNSSSVSFYPRKKIYLYISKKYILTNTLFEFNSKVKKKSFIHSNNH